jgi:ribosomal protein S18 acetylase RimI-like enzyme
MITYRPIQVADYQQVQKFLIAHGWANRVEDSSRFRAMIEGTSLTVVALDDQRVIGFARAVCDGVSNGYISMVAVDKDWRRQGVGRRMIEEIMNVNQPDNITWVLRAGPGSEAFWRSVGFEPSAVAMERVRRS